MRRSTGLITQNRVRSLLIAAGTAAAATAANAQQWTAINLHPAGATSSVAEGIDGVYQVGTVDVDGGAVLWNSSAASVIRLNPYSTYGSIGRALRGGVQVGSVTIPRGTAARAAIWSGTPQSWVDIHPAHMEEVTSTVAYAFDGDTIGGTYFIDTGAQFVLGRPCIWTDATPESWVDLLPPGYTTGEVLGVHGDIQVGATYEEFLGKAAMWSGSAASFVDLNPPEAFASSATCTDGTHQYGVVAAFTPVPGIYAARWSGTAESWEDMGSPEGWFGGISATHGGWHSGSIQSPDGVEERAAVWTGGPGSYQDLHSALPPGYLTSIAQGIWRHLESGTTYVVGSAVSEATNQPHAMMWVTGPGVNLITSAEAPPSCSAAPGDAMVFTSRIINAGAEESGPVTLTVNLPPTSVATFAGSSPAPTMVSPSQVTIQLPSIPAHGGFADVTVTLTAVQAGANAEVLFTANAAGEVHADNNAALASSIIVPIPPTGGPNLATALVSTDPNQANSLVPGLGGARFTSLGNPTASPSGQWWAMLAGTDLEPLQRHLVVRAPADGSPAVIAQYGVTTTSNGAITDILPGVKVNDAGLVAFGGADTSRFVATTDGSTLSEIAREGHPIPSIPGDIYAAQVGGSVNLFADGAVAFRAVTGLTVEQTFLSDNGSTVIARSFHTTPDGTEYLILDLDDHIFGHGGCQFDATGDNYIYAGRLATGDPTIDRVLVVNGRAIAQEGLTILPGMSSPVADSHFTFTMSPGGIWMARGSNLDGETWVARGQGSTISRIFRFGDPIHAGATETWALDPITPPFFIFASDAAGNFVLGSTTSNPDDYADTVLVYNDQEVIARENDPVDLDGNGVFDDGVYIRSFESYSAAFIDGALLVKVTLRDEAAALCHANDESRGQAIVRIPLPGGGCPADWDNSGSVNSNDISAFLSSWLESVQNGTLTADFDGSGSVNSNDISAFLSAWLHAVGGGC